MRWFLPALLAVWAAFAAWCVHGFPPCVDLPAHGAQLETLAALVRGDSAVAARYQVQFPLGYGLPFWAFLPVALISNGAVAARVALWTALMLFPLSQLALVRAFRRPDWYLLFGLPLAFNVSYWYGLLSGVFAQPFVFLALAAYVRALDERRARWLWAGNAAAAAALLSHLVAFAALGAALVAVAAVRRPWGRSLRVLVACVAAPALLSVPKVYAMATRAVTPGPWEPTRYALDSHVNWFFRNYRPEGVLAAAAPLTVSAVFVALYLLHRRRERVEPAAAFLGLGVLYAITPHTLSGIFLIAVRLPVLAAMVSLLLVSAERLGRWRYPLVALCLASLVETAMFHARFRREVRGLAELIREPPPPGVHGYVSLVGREVLGSRHVYLDHLGQWWTATHGGVGHNFFADADHHPVRFRPGGELPADLWHADAGTFRRFSALLVFGDAPLPAALAGWRQVEQAGRWRKLLPPAP